MDQRSWRDLSNTQRNSATKFEVVQNKSMHNESDVHYIEAIPETLGSGESS